MRRIRDCKVLSVQDVQGSDFWKSFGLSEWKGEEG